VLNQHRSWGTEPHTFVPTSLFLAPAPSHAGSRELLLATLIISAAGLLVAFVVLAAVAFSVLFNDDRNETRGDDTVL